MNQGIDPAILAAAPPDPEEVDEDEDPTDHEVETGEQSADAAAPADKRPPNLRTHPSKIIRDPRIKWTKILEKLYGDGMMGDAITIAVQRTGLGLNNRSAPEDLPDAIDGASVSGSEGRAPGDELISYLTDCYHLAQQESRWGVCRYKLTFTGKNTGRWYGWAEITLPHPKEILTQRNRASQYAHPPAEGGWPSGSGVPPRPRMQGSPPLAGFRAPAQPASDEVRLLTELARLDGRYAALLEQRAQSTSPETMTAQGIAEAVKTGIVEAFKLAGIGQPTAPAGAPQAPVAPAPPPTPAEVAATTKDPIESLETIFEQVERIDKFKARVRAFAGVPETPEVKAEVVSSHGGASAASAPYETFELPDVTIDGEAVELVGVSGVDGDFGDWLKAAANANPKLVIAAVKNIASRFMRQPVAHGPTAAAAAQATADQMANGVAGPTA
jgi:hypothetical protein